MLRAFQLKKALKTSFKSEANSLPEQIARLGKASPIAEHQQQLVQQIQNMAQALKDTVLDEQISTKKFEIVVEERVEQVLRNIIKNAAEHMTQEQAANKTAVSQAESCIDQTLAVKKTTAWETARQRVNPKAHEIPANVKVKTSELMHVLKREAKEMTEQHEKTGLNETQANGGVKISEPPHVFKRKARGKIRSFEEEKLSQTAATKSEQQVNTEKITVLPRKGAEKFFAPFEKMISRQLQNITQAIKKKGLKEVPEETQIKKRVIDQEVMKQKKRINVTSAVTKQVHLKSLITYPSTQEETIESGSSKKIIEQKESTPLAQQQTALDTKITAFLGTVPKMGVKEVLEETQAKKPVIYQGAMKQKESTSLAQKLKSLVEVGQMPRSEEAQAPAKEISAAIPGRKPAAQQQTAPDTKITTSLGAVPEEIVTAAQWITEEEVEQQLVEILSRQAKLRGVDLS